MTQEEKAIAYDKVREKIAIRFGSNIAKEIFSEYEESEDERIRKELLNHLKEASYGKTLVVSTLDYKRWVDWLEKQGEKGTNGNKGEFPILEPPLTLKRAKEVMGIDQPPADKIEPKFKVGQTIKKEGFNLGFTIAKIEDGFYYNDEGDYFPFTGQDNWELVEQKPGWSEEDKKIWEEISDMLWEGYRQSCSKFTWDNIRDWIKPKIEYFKDRTQPQQEWSEEDKYRIDEIIHALDACEGEWDSDMSKEKDWLKSLRPQNTWKPTEEQIRVVNRLRHCFLSDVSGNDIVILDALLEQLREL